MDNLLIHSDEAPLPGSQSSEAERRPLLPLGQSSPKPFTSPQSGSSTQDQSGICSRTNDEVRSAHVSTTAHTSAATVVTGGELTTSLFIRYKSKLKLFLL